MWFDAQPDLDPERLVFIDETGASTKMARLRGRALRGQRCRAPIPPGHWKTTTFTGALRLSGLTAPMVLDGPMNREAVLTYVDRVLAPTLQPGDLVVMDNLPAHRCAGVRATIEAAGWEMTILAPCSFSSAMTALLSKAFVGDQPTEGEAVDERRNADRIEAVAGHKNEAPKVAERIGQGKDVSRHTALGAAYGLALSPPFAPWPWRWTLTIVASTMAYSISGSSEQASKSRLNTSALAQSR